MHRAVAFIAVGVFALSHAAPLDLGAGGVFKGAEAQSYFATRFGSDFFTRLAAVMAKSGAAPSPAAPSPRKSSTSAHAQRAKKEDRPELKFETKHSDSEPAAAAEGEGKVAVAVSDSLYRDAVAPRTTKGASDYEEQDTNTL